MSSGLVRGQVWRRLFLVADGMTTQFQCQLFHLVQALIFGGHAWGFEYFAWWIRSDYALRYLCQPLQAKAYWVGEVMGLLLGFVRLPLFVFWMSFQFSLVTSQVRCCAVGGLLLLRYCAARFGVFGAGILLAGDENLGFGFSPTEGRSGDRCCLVRQWIHVHASVLEASLDDFHTFPT